MIFAMGGTAEGEISIRSSPAAFAAASAAASESTPRFPPSLLITRNSCARISLFMRSRSVATGSDISIAQNVEGTQLFRKLAWVGEDYFGFALIRRDFAGEGDGCAGVAGEVAKLFYIVGEYDA